MEPRQSHLKTLVTIVLDNIAFSELKYVVTLCITSYSAVPEE